MEPEPTRPRPSFARARALTAALVFGPAPSRDPTTRLWTALAAAIALGAVLAQVALVLAPWFRDTTTFGFHDWDVQTSHRELVRKTLLEHREFPGWNPYACGGFPAWGYVEGATTLVSPYLPLYLALPMPLALRLEVLGQALVGALGAYALAGRFTRSHAARALAAVLWAVNGRWALQAASGHTWHLAYAFTPVAFTFFERALDAPPGPARRREAALLGATFAALVYAGGIYPLPHTALALGVYALARCFALRSAAPLALVALGGAIGIGLSAPKLLPLLDGFGKAPRLIESTERLDLGHLVTLLTSRKQAFYDRPAPVTPYGWHEWGMYVSAAGAAVLFGALFFARGRRALPLVITGGLFAVLGLGAFHPSAPWPLVHAHVPVFKSQHVPSRFLYTAVLLLGVAAAEALGRRITRAGVARPWLDAACACAVFALAVDVASVAQKPMADAMCMVAPDVRAADRFTFAKDPPYQYKKRDWAGPMYLAMRGNVGVLNCYGTPPFERKGAHAARGDAAYRGEAWLAGAAAAGVTLERWSPNTATVRAAGVSAGPGAHLVYNMNFDEGWHATVERNGSASREVPVVPLGNAVAVAIEDGDSRVQFEYRPPGLRTGLVLCALTIAALALALRRAGAS